MQRWHISIVLAGATVVAAALAPRLFPRAAPRVFEPTVEPVVVAPPAPPPVVDAPPRHVDVVLALDTSGSMDSLLDGARARLWDIVNTVDAEDPEAELRVALIAFGSPRWGAENGYVKILQPLTDDLDSVYTAAFTLTTNGGDEYVGTTVKTALDDLAWTPEGNPDDRRLLFIAGNEGAYQGPHDPDAMARLARSRGVIVSTLFAGTDAGGRSQGWHTVAEAGGGKFLTVNAEDSARGVASTPYDAEIQRLNETLNGTYVAWGSAGAQKLGELRANDDKAGTMGAGSLVSRIAAKGGKKFKTASWDLVEASEQGLVDVRTVDAKDLPADLAELGVADRVAEVERRKAARSAAKQQLETLSKKRAAHLDEVRDPYDAGLDQAMTEALSDLL
ncbi:MAG: VWA domain-containing protein [Alphaproteobacteria bacterium]|nr:VWA domain-containing protein [Alphaproteobacteria bacterium]